MDFESVAEEVYTAAREDFVAVRDARARQARADGDDTLAGRIRELRKPSVAAWLLNHLARRYPDEITGLSTLNASLRAAHAALAGDELRRLSRERRDLIGRLNEFARATARETRQTLSESVARQVQDSFEAALTDSAAADIMRTGRLTSALEAGTSAGWLTSTAQPEPGKSGGQSAPRRGRAAAPAEADTRQRELGRARTRADRTASDRDVAARVLADADEHHIDAASAVEDLRQLLDNARRVERQTGDEARAARKSFDRADRAATAAQRELDELQRRPPDR